MAHRSDLNTLTPPQRTQLVNLMLSYLTDAVVADHVSIVHSGLELFTGHRAYLLGMENFLLASGGAAFVPLPFWNSATPIPSEFNVVKNPGPGRPPLQNLNPSIPKPPQFEHPAVCEYDDPAQLGNDINGWHGSVHCAIGGTMCMLPVASAAPIFWCWHAFVDHIYWDWQRCTVPCPDVAGCTLEVARRKLRAAGLALGAKTCLPECALPSGYRPPASRDPDPTRYFHGQPNGHGGHDDSGHEPAGQPHAHAQAGPSRQAVSRRAGGPTQVEPTAPHGGHPASPEFVDPRPDYEYLTRGPRVIAQCPAPYTTVRVGTAVDLTLAS
ncbi:MAG TPA: tyrosinase family protein [Methylomirabilota bacterium]|nr:tyrosinase family protein [Methylomirabilota bacterium]